MVGEGSSMPHERLSDAIEAWREALGGDHVWTGPEAARYADNVTAWTRDIPAVLFPADTGAVASVVAAANRYRVPLYNRAVSSSI
jgi:FAD/FMN-containing dehydrogenase